MESPWATPKTKNNFFSEITKADSKLSRPFYFNKIPYVLAELCFSILCLCIAFLLKSAISSHNSFSFTNFLLYTRHQSPEEIEKKESGQLGRYLVDRCTYLSQLAQLAVSIVKSKFFFFFFFGLSFVMKKCFYWIFVNNKN